MITPKQKIALGRTFADNPSLGIIELVEMLRSDILDSLKNDVALLRSKTTAEMTSIVDKKLKALTANLPDVETILETIKGKDASAEEVMQCLMKNQDFMAMCKAKDGITPSDAQITALIAQLMPTFDVPQDGHTPTTSELLQIIRPLIPEIRDGRTPTKEEIVALIQQVIPKPIEVTGESIVDMVNGLAVEPSKQIDARHIKNLPIVKSEKQRASRPGDNTRSLTFVLDTPTSSDVFPIWQVPKTVTITKVWATVRGGTSSTFNIEKRTSSALNSSGTDILSSDLVATQAGASSTSFVAGTSVISPQYFLVFVASALSGTVDQIVIEIDYTINN